MSDYNNWLLSHFKPQMVFLNLDTTIIKASYYRNENTKGLWRGHIAKEGLYYIIRTLLPLNRVMEIFCFIDVSLDQFDDIIVLN